MIKHGTIGNRIAFGFGIMAVLLLAVGVITLWRFGTPLATGASAIDDAVKFGDMSV